MSILNILEEQSNFGFTGKVNVLLKSNNQLLGAIYQNEGVIVSAEFDGITGKKALYQIIFKDVDEEVDLKFLVEPEIIEDEKIDFQVDFSNLYKNTQERFVLYKKFRPYMPPLDKYLKVNRNFLNKGDSLSAEEFKVLTFLVDFPMAKDLYKYCPLYDYEITQQLVSLRKKKAIIVVEKKGD